MTTQTATIETLTAEVRVLMVGSRQVTLSVYRQLDRCKSDQIEPFGRVSDKQDEPKYMCRSVFVVGRDATGTLVRSEHVVIDESPQREKDLVDRRVADNDRREYGNDLRQLVKPFAEERRIEDRREHRRRIKGGGGVWMWSEHQDEYEERHSRWVEAGDRYDEWQHLPRNVLAGRRCGERE